MNAIFMGEPPDDSDDDIEEVEGSGRSAYLALLLVPFGWNKSYEGTIYDYAKLLDTAIQYELLKVIAAKYPEIYANFGNAQKWELIQLVFNCISLQVIVNAVEGGDLDIISFLDSFFASNANLYCQIVDFLVMEEDDTIEEGHDPNDKLIMSKPSGWSLAMIESLRDEVLKRKFVLAMQVPVLGITLN